MNLLSTYYAMRSQMLLLQFVFLSVCSCSLNELHSIIITIILYICILTAAELTVPVPTTQNAVRKHLFTQRIVNLWNSLPTQVVHALLVNDFKNKLDAHWSNQKMVHNHRVEISGTGSRSIGRCIALNLAVPYSITSVSNGADPGFLFTLKTTKDN